MPFIKKKTIKGKLCPWLTDNLKNAMNYRDNLLRSARKKGTEVSWSSYKRQKNHMNNTLKKAKSEYHKNLLEENISQPQKFWSYIKSLYPTKAHKM